ncbi:hypothetical protein MMC07_003677 [Pseudocyphellaria aurata]|nr:hypothetical protein [Pseudocyphellaria aurata]
MEVWTGKIIFDDSPLDLKDVHFVNTRCSPTSFFPSNTKLQFLSFVEVAAIPIHLAAGPSLDVWTHNELTEQWLSSSLLDDWIIKENNWTKSAEAWWHRPVQQSDRGILLRVEDGSGDNAGSERKITEVVIYAALSKEVKSHVSLPTPPRSSSPNADLDVDGATSNDIIHDIKIYALPLCSTNSTLVDDIRGLTSPTSCHKSSDIEVRLLSSLLPRTTCIFTSPRKRQRISTMFDDATSQRKRLMKHGGDRVSKAMAAIDGAVIQTEKPTSSSLSMDKGATWTDQPKEDQQSELPRGLLSRASSTSSLRGDESSRPSSRRGPLLNAKRSHLNPVNGIASMSESSRISQSTTIEQQNKAALTRLIMTGMRIYGLQQRKKSVKPQAEFEMEEGPFRESSRLLEEEEQVDYKLIYHQTFKAASFTFRNNMSSVIINQELLRDVVDSLLVMFCNDPLASHNTNDSFGAKGGKDGTVGLKAFNGGSTGITLPTAADVF